MASSEAEKPAARKGRRHLRKPHVPKIVGRIVSRVHKAPGSAPGTLIHTGQKKVDKVRIRLIDYDRDSIEERTLDSIEECYRYAEEPPVSWINIDGLHEVSVIAAVGDRFGVHRLALEDVLSTTTRPKVEEYDEHFLVIVKMLSFEEETDTVLAEQVSFVVGERYLFSFQERYGDVFEPVRERLRDGQQRIRARGTDYLAYALIDAVVDRYFRILETIGDRIEELEAEVLGDPSIELMHRIHSLKREVLVIRRAVWPLREALGTLYRGEVKHVREETQLFLRDVYDHCVQVIDTVETLREVLSSTMDLYMSGVSNRMNEVMKVLTIIATIFIPLGFIAGLYGMNFDPSVSPLNMPELGWRWGSCWRSAGDSSSSCGGVAG